MTKQVKESTASKHPGEVSLDHDYLEWIAGLKQRFRATQIKAAVAVNSALIEFYWNLGRDVSERYPCKRRGIDFFGKLSRDLKHAIPDARGVAFLGREYQIEIGGETKSIDLLFYIIPLHRYLVLEVKTGKYEPADFGQLSGYVVMVEHVLNRVGDNSPVGILVCKEHNRVLAKYHLEKFGIPMAIADYELRKVLPTQSQLAKCYRDAEKQIAERILHHS